MDSPVAVVKTPALEARVLEARVLESPVLGAPVRQMFEPSHSGLGTCPGNWDIAANCPSFLAVLEPDPSNKDNESPDSP